MRDGGWDDIASRYNTSFQPASSLQQAFDRVQAGGDGTIAVLGIRYRAMGGASNGRVKWHGWDKNEKEAYISIDPIIDSQPKSVSAEGASGDITCNFN
jgi:hypothetical protein